MDIGRTSGPRTRFSGESLDFVQNKYFWGSGFLTRCAGFKPAFSLEKSVKKFIFRGSAHSFCVTIARDIGVTLRDMLSQIYTGSLILKEFS